MERRLAPLILGFGLFFEGCTFTWEEVYAYNRMHNPIPETVDIIEKKILDVIREKGWDPYWGMELLKVFLVRVSVVYYDIMIPCITELIEKEVKPKQVIEYIDDTVGQFWDWATKKLRKKLSQIPLEIRRRKFSEIAKEKLQKILKI